MPYEEKYDSISRNASGALATTRVGVLVNSSDALAAATAGGPIDGILLTSCTASTDEPSYVPVNNCLGGINVRAGGTCTAGADAMVTTDGKFIDATPGNTTVGRFETGTTTSGDLVRMLPYARPQAVKGGLRMATLALSGATVHAAAGGVVAWQNPEGADIIVNQVILDVTTVATGACTLDVGYTATSAATTSDTMLDGVDVNAAVAIFDSRNHGLDTGANAFAQRVASGKWITVDEKTGDATGLVGKLYIFYIIP